VKSKLQPYPLDKIIHIKGVRYPESLSVGPQGEAYTTGTGGEVYRINLRNNTGEQFASTAPRRVLGQAVDAAGNLYCADVSTGRVIRLTPNGEETTYATGPGGQPFSCTNYPVFTHDGYMLLSDSGDWSDAINGHIYVIPPGGGEARLWFPEPVDTPNGMAVDADEQYLYFVETFGPGIARIGINKDRSAGTFERVVHMPRHVPDSIAFDADGRLWIACHRPDSIHIFNLQTRTLELFAEDWRGEALRGPTDVAFVGPDRDILLAASLDNMVVHRFDNINVRGLRPNNPKL
jgi:sugar lactone lactonase YvrE